MEEDLAKGFESISKILGILPSKIVEKALDFYMDYIDEMITKEWLQNR